MKHPPIYYIVLRALLRCRSLLNLQGIAARLEISIDELDARLAEVRLGANLYLPAFRPHQLASLRFIGEMLGATFESTELEVVPLQAEMTISEYYNPDDSKSLDVAKGMIGRDIATELLKLGVISFEVIPWQQVQQRAAGDRDWKLQAKLQVLIEK